VCAFADVTERRTFEQAARQRDAAEIRAAESRAAHRRIVEGIAAVRQQAARDLHDGAQQRLVSLVLGLRLAREHMAGSSAEALTLIDHSISEAQAAIDELRELAAGIHPPILTTRGLSSAVDTLATRCPVPTVVRSTVDRRLPAAVESNAYFLVSEALTNAAKHSRASRIDISLSLGSELTITVGDNGIGGISDDAAGSGLIGLRDRVAAFDGALSIESPIGRGTTIRARIPLPEEF
jgi:signal transduction histidine kinase